MATGNPRKARTFGPNQLRDHLELTQWQFDRLRARKRGGIPAPTEPQSRWAADVVDRLVKRRRRLVEAAGRWPDMGPTKVGGVIARELGLIRTPDPQDWSERFSVCPTPDGEHDVHNGVADELVRLGHLAVTDYFHDVPLYDALQLEVFLVRPDARTIVEQAIKDGELLMTDQATARLGVRPIDFAALVTHGYLKPAAMVRSVYQRSKDRPKVPLYRVADLDALPADTRLPWAELRAARPGQRTIVRPPAPARITPRSRRKPCV
jgi:hypothetical protein